MKQHSVRHRDRSRSYENKNRRNQHRRRSPSSSSYSSHSSQDKRKRDQKERHSNKGKEVKRNDRKDKKVSVFDFSDSEVKSKNKNDIKSKTEEESKEQEIEKEEPCFEPSGILAEFSNQFNGVVLKFTEPLDAAKPLDQWRLYPFKGEETLSKIDLSKKSCFLFGRDPRAADIILENPSCSLQHAVLQFRERQITRELSQEEQTARGVYQGYITETIVKPYIMDLESTNKTFLNSSELEPARYYELREKDVLKFGESQREYVLMKK